MSLPCFRAFSLARDIGIADINGDLEMDLFVSRRKKASDVVQLGPNLVRADLITADAGLPEKELIVYAPGSFQICVEPINFSPNIGAETDALLLRQSDQYVNNL